MKVESPIKEAESRLLGSMLGSPRVRQQVYDTLGRGTHAFNYEAHIRIMKTILALDILGERVDVFSVRSSLGSDSENYLTDLLAVRDAISVRCNLANDIKLLKDTMVKRSFKRLLKSNAVALERGSNNVEHILSRVEAGIRDIRQGRTPSGPEPVGDILASMDFSLNEERHASSGH